MNPSPAFTNCKATPTPRVAISNEPLISAVICTYNRAPLLRRALGALCGQTLGLERFEVIVIDDGSTDDTRAEVEHFANILSLRYAYQTNSGLATGKNHGLFLARAPLVVFLDDDDVLDSRCLEEHYLTHQLYQQPHDAVLGYTGLAHEPAQSPLMRYVTEIGCQLFSYPSLTPDTVLDFSYFWGGRSSCKRKFLLEHGVFNPLFRFGAEDIELGFRLEPQGLRVIYNPRAISYMIRTLTFEDFCRRCYLQGRSNWVFSELHPHPLVHAWARLQGIEANWEIIASRFDVLMQAGQGLDRYAQERARLDLPLDELTMRLLHRAYAAAFDANRIRGSIDRMREGGKPPAFRNTVEKLTQDIHVNFVNRGTLIIRAFADHASYHAFGMASTKYPSSLEANIISSGRSIQVDGFCHVCDHQSRLILDFTQAYRMNGQLVPNWRETLVCPGCGLNNRMRAAIHLFDQVLNPLPNSLIYLTEQASHFFTQMKSRYSGCIGSEYLEEDIPEGSINNAGIRHEDVTRLSFSDESIDYVLSFDVLEHIPNYQTALAEIHRVLRPGGALLLSVPFLPDSDETLVRAERNANGVITHLMPPEYHIDPLREKGSLSFYQFGWHFLRDLRAAGFTDVRALYHRSDLFGYLGSDPLLFIARKP